MLIEGIIQCESLQMTFLLIEITMLTVCIVFLILMIIAKNPV